MFNYYYFIVLCRKFVSPYLHKVQQLSPYLIKVQQLQGQCYPFLSVCAVFSCVQTMVGLPVLEIFNMHTDIDACSCTQGLYNHCKIVCIGSSFWEQNPLLQWGPEAMSVLHLVFQSDVLPTELSTPLHACACWHNSRWSINGWPIFLFCSFLQ